MGLQKKDIKKLAHLSRIKLTDAEEDKYPDQMTTIIESVDTLNEIDVTNTHLQPTKTVGLRELREDIIEESMPQSDAIENAPFKKDGFVMVYGDLKDDSAA